MKTLKRNLVNNLWGLGFPKLPWTSHCFLSLVFSIVSGDFDILIFCVEVIFSLTPVILDYRPTNVVLSNENMVYEQGHRSALVLILVVYVLLY